jgi:hypothetical protein
MPGPAVVAVPKRALTLTHGFSRAATTCYARHQSTNASSKPEQSATTSLSPRWLSDVKQRIGKCITFGLKPHQVDEAGKMLAEISQDWRELVAGSEGFLTGPKRRGLYRQEVVWGEMDSMVGLRRTNVDQDGRNASFSTMAQG